MRNLARLTACAAAFAAFGSAGAMALEEVKFGTNWVAQAEHGGYYQAVANGTYEACGLKVTIVPGGPQVNNRILLAAGKIEFLMGGNMLQAFSAVEQGIPTKVVAAHFQKEPQVILSHPGKGFDTWESLKGATLFIGKGGLNSYYRWMIAEYGFTENQVKPYTYNPAPFIADTSSGQQGYITSEPFAIKREAGWDPNIFLIADHGYDSYATTVETLNSLITDKPAVVKCFVEGSAIGWTNYLYGDNSAANALIQTDNPDMSEEQIAFSIDKMKEYGIVDSGASLTMGIGAMTAERHKSFFDKMVKAGVVDAGVDHTQSYTLDFVNNKAGLDIKKSLTGQ